MILSAYRCHARACPLCICIRIRLRIRMHTHGHGPAQGVNIKDNDEVIDVRQALYKEAAVVLSVKAAVKALCDWAAIDDDEYAELAAAAERSDLKEQHAEEAEDAAAAAASSSSSSSTTTRPRARAPAPREFVAEQPSRTLARLVAARAQAKTGRRLTHVVGVTCTGVIVPGLEFHVMQQLGLDQGVERLRYEYSCTCMHMRCMCVLGAQARVHVHPS
jgi:hypothetical protein